MSEEQLKAFLEKVKGDSSLQEKIKAATDPETVVVIAKEAGFSIFADSLAKAESGSSDELSSEELEGVAGGTLTNCNARDTWSTPPAGRGVDKIGEGAKNIGNLKKTYSRNRRTHFEIYLFARLAAYLVSITKQLFFVTDHQSSSNSCPVWYFQRHLNRCHKPCA